MKNTNFQVNQFSFIRPLIKRLENTGYNLKPIKTRIGLDYFDLSYSNCYLPVPLMHSFLQEVWLQVGTKNFIFKFRNYLAIETLLKVEEASDQPTNMKDLLKVVSSCAPVFMTNLNIQLSPKTESVEISIQLSAERNLGKRLLEQIWLAYLLNLFENHIGNGFTLFELHVPTHTHEEIRPMLPKGDYLIRYRQKHYTLVLDKMYMKQPITIARPIKINEVLSIPQGNKAITNIEKVILSYNSYYRPNLENLAFQFGLSSRTMKRHLRCFNSKFSDILTTCLFHRALKLLCEENIKIEEISESLGYSDSPNFIRSFKTWTGISPAVFRTTFFKEPTITMCELANS